MLHLPPEVVAKNSKSSEKQGIRLTESKINTIEKIFFGNTSFQLRPIIFQIPVQTGIHLISQKGSNKF